MSDNPSAALRKVTELITGNPASARIGIVGKSAEGLFIAGELVRLGISNNRITIYNSVSVDRSEAFLVKEKPLQALSTSPPEIVLIASDADKESLLDAAVGYLPASTHIILYGYEHFQFKDKIYDEVTANPLVPSLANGYPNTLIHIFQCLRNASRLGCRGVVAEFGMFKGGTTMLISQFIERLGQNWKVYGFDTFGGFPPKRSALDMYEHPGCVFRDEMSVRRYLTGRNVEVVAGDIVETAKRLSDEDIVVSFIDTDNYSSAYAILDVIQDRVVPGGAIVFDHFTGRDRFLYTLGERMAGKRLLDDARYFNLHDTGVFLRMR